MDIYDVIVTILYVVLAYAIAFFVHSFNRNNALYKKYFVKGLTAKLIGGLGFALVYTYYYKYGGDTFTYYSDAQMITRYLFEDPVNAIRLMLDPETVKAPAAKQIVRRFGFSHTTSEFPVVRTAALLNVLAMNSYYSTTILFASFSYFGVWLFFLVFAGRYPEIRNQLAVAILFIPSVFFWGSGIMKDSMVIGYLGVLFYAINRFLKGGLARWFWLFLAVVCGAIIFSIKAYVIMALAPALMLWVVMNSREKIRNKILRALVVPVLFIVAIVAVVGVVDLLGKYQTKYSIENFYSSAESMQSWHYVEGQNTSDEHGRGSSYSLGDYDPSFWGTLKVFPSAVNVTLFRPYLWEVKNAAMLASALESLVVLIFTLVIFVGLGFFRVIRLLFQDSFLMMCFTFAVFFAFAVGFSSYNFGALVRYKIPCIPFYLATLLILNHKVKQIKERKKWRAKQRLAGMERVGFQTQ